MSSVSSNPLPWPDRIIRYLFAFGLDRKTFSRARTASDFSRTIKLTAKSRLCIVGGHCANANGHPNGNPTSYPTMWLDKIRQMGRDAEFVEYALIEPSDSAWKNLKAIESESNGKIKLYRIPTPDQILTGNLRARQVVRECEVSHFALIDEPKQIWIEGFHPKEYTEAQAVEYVPPNEAENDPRYLSLKHKFELLKSVAVSE